MISSRGRIRWLALAVAASLIDLPSHAGDRPKERGAHFTLSLVGGELNAPRQSATTDLELFTGLGLTLAGGYRFGRVRLEGEFHAHHAERAFTGDTVGMRSLMFNTYVDLPVSARFGFFVGLGLGVADVDVEIDTCLDLQGCPALAAVSQSASATARQLTLGVGYSPSPGRQMFVAYRWFRTGSLGLVDTVGRGFSEDGVDMPMALLGYSWRFSAPRGGR